MKWILPFAFALLAALGAAARAQIPIPTAAPYIQNFDAMGGGLNATLPAGWRVGSHNSARNAGSYPNSGDTTNKRGGDNMASNALSGVYNFGAGPASSASDRAVGGLAAPNYMSVNVYAWLRNDTGAPLDGLVIAYGVEKYRRGSNPAGFSVRLHYSSDGINWTAAGAPFETAFGADLNNNGFTPAPGETRTVSGALPVPIPVNDVLYLAWNYSVTSGSTTSNAQALGIDDVFIKGFLGQPPTTPTVTSAAFTPASVDRGEDALLAVSVVPAPGVALASVTADVSTFAGASPVTLTRNPTTGKHEATVQVRADAPPGDHAVTVVATGVNNETGEAVATLTVLPPPLSVAAFRAALPADVVRVTGVVTAIHTGNPYISDVDGGAGVMVFDGTPTDGIPELRQGDIVLARGRCAEINNEVGLDVSEGTVIVLSSDNALPAPAAITVGQANANDDYEGRLVAVRGLRVTQAAPNLTSEGVDFVAEDAGGATIRIRIEKNTTRLANAPYPKDALFDPIGVKDGDAVTFPDLTEGRALNITGVLGDSTSGKRIKLRSALDIGTDVVSYNVGAPVYASVTAYNGVAYVGSEDGKLHAWDLIANQPAPGFPVQVSSGTIASRPALRLVNGALGLYISTMKSTAHRVNIDGTIAWSAQLGDDKTITDATPAVVGAEVFVPVWGGGGVSLVKLDAVTGSDLGRTTVSGVNAASSPSVLGNMLYITTDQGVQYVHTGAMTPKAELSTKASSAAPFILSVGQAGSPFPHPVVYAVTQDGAVVAANASNGQPITAGLWGPHGEVNTNAYLSNPSLYAWKALNAPNAMLYFNCQGGETYRVNAGTGEHALFFDLNREGSGGVMVDPGGRSGAGTLVFGTSYGRIYQVPLDDPAEFIYWSVPSTTLLFTASVDNATGTLVISATDGMLYRFPRY